MTKTWCLGGRHYSNTNIITQYEKRKPKTKNLLELSKKNVIFVLVMNDNFFPNKWLEEKTLSKKQIVKIIIAHLCQIQYGVIWIIKVIYWNYMTNVLILNVIAKKSKLLHLINISSRVDRLYVNYKKFLKERKKLGIVLLSQVWKWLHHWYQLLFLRKQRILNQLKLRIVF